MTDPTPPVRCPHVFGDAVRCIHPVDDHPVAEGGKKLAHLGWLPGNGSRVTWKTTVRR